LEPGNPFGRELSVSEGQLISHWGDLSPKGRREEDERMDEAAAARRRFRYGANNLSAADERALLLERPPAEPLKGSPHVVVGRVVDRGVLEFLRGAPQALKDVFASAVRAAGDDDDDDDDNNEEEKEGGDNSVSAAAAHSSADGGSGSVDGLGAEGLAGETKYTIVVRRDERAALYDEDVDFVGEVCEAMTEGFKCINGRSFRAEARERALAAILELCKSWEVSFDDDVDRGRVC
jgi:hypothetical protein